MASDWQLGCTTMKQRGGHLLQSGLRSDCIFLVGTAPNIVMVSAHKFILAMASPVFEAMFYGAMAVRNDLIPILDVQLEAFKALLEYIYTDNISIGSFDEACELCYGAKKYMLPHLMKECTRYLLANVYPKNACRAYEFARFYEEKGLMDKSIQIISTNTKEVLIDSSFEEVELNTVITVFSLDNLRVNSELDLFEAAVRYAKAQGQWCSERGASPAADNGGAPTETNLSPGSFTLNKQGVNVDGSVNSPASEPEQTTPRQLGDDGEKNKDTMGKPTVRSAIEKIRFLTLTAQQFAAGPARSSLLSESEAFAILMNILSSQAAVPMPQGFSTCRAHRKLPIGDSSNSMMATKDTYDQY